MKTASIELQKGKHFFDDLAWLKLGELIREAGLEWKRDGNNGVDYLDLKSDLVLTISKKKKPKALK